MTSDEVRTVLFRSAKLRMPRFDDRDTTGMRIDKLETYLLTMALTRGDLEEARLNVQQALYNLQGVWDALTGYEIHLPNKKTYTQHDYREAKRLHDPDTHAGIEEAKWLISRLTEQINRLSHMGDDQVASRIYTLLAGS